MLLAYELLVVILLVANLLPKNVSRPPHWHPVPFFDWGAWDIWIQAWVGVFASVTPNPITVILLILLFAPFVLPALWPRISSVTLPFFGGATIELKEIQARIEIQDRKLEKLSADTDHTITSLASYILTPPHQNEVYRQSVDKRLKMADTLYLGCTDYTEQRLLCAIVAALLTNVAQTVEGIPKGVETRYDFGSPGRNFTALLRRQLDIYSVYTWTGFELSLGPFLQHIHIEGRPLQDFPGEEAVKWLNKIYEKGQSPEPLTWLHPYGFHNNWHLVMRRTDAKAKNIKRITDLKGRSEELTLGCWYQFYAREAAYGAVRSAGIHFKEVKFYSHADVYGALGKGEVDIIDGFTTDPQLHDRNFFPLDEEPRLFGQYFAVPVVRTEVIRTYPRIGTALKVLGGSIDNEEMQEMIYLADKVPEERMDEHIESVKKVAVTFLKRKGLIRRAIEEAKEASQEAGRPL